MTVVKSDEPEVVIGESGLVTVGQPNKNTWQSVQFKRSYANPVVFAQILTFNGHQPVTVRIKDLAKDGFKFQMDEWEYLDQYHVTETIAYMVLEAGRHTLADGTILEVGKVQAGSSSLAVNFKGSFGRAPIVFSQVQTFNDAQAVVTRQQNISSSGFQLSLQGEEKAPNHQLEGVGYVALEATQQNSTIELGTIDKIGSAWSYVKFQKSHTDEELVLFAAMQTTNDANTAGLRFNKLTDKGVSIFIEEEGSKDSEVGHEFENVGYLVFKTGFIQ